MWKYICERLQYVCDTDREAPYKNIIFMLNNWLLEDGLLGEAELQKVIQAVAEIDKIREEERLSKKRDKVVNLGEYKKLKEK